MANYNYSDGDMTFGANGDTTLHLMNDPFGTFDIKSFSFLKSGSDLLIYANNGGVITLQDHYSSNSSFVFINFGTLASPRIQVISNNFNVSVGTSDNTSFGSNEHILGGTGDNVITANSSRIYAGSGNDIITNNSNGNSNTGNLIYAGDGDDTIYEGIGAGDDAYGGDGNDTFYANSSAVNGSTWRGDAGNDSYYVKINSSGTKIYDSSGALDTLYFGAGLNFQNFLMYGSANGMTIVSKDVNALGVFEVTLKEQYTENIDKVVFADGTTYCIENGIDWYADDTDNEIDAAAGLYNLHGGLGNDVIRGVTYVDTREYGILVTNWIPALYGDEGDDTIYHGWTGIGDPRSGGVSFGGAGNDIIHGTDYDDVMHGGDGNDTFYAYGHDNATSDIMDGGNGDDTFYIGTGTQKDVEGGAGHDVIYSELNAGPVHFTGSGKTHLKGGLDNDTYVFLRDDTSGAISAPAWINDVGGDYDTVALGVGFSLNNVNIKGLAFLTVTDLHPVLGYYMIDVNPYIPNNVIERISFADGTIYDTTTNTVLTATNGDDDPIYLSAWHDTFDSLAGDDVVYALEGDDILLGNAGTDHFDGGKGSDTVDYSNAAARIKANLSAQFVSDDGDGANDTLASIENIKGSAFNDVIYGSSGNNIIDGGDGDDQIITYAGDDFVYGGAGRDLIWASADSQIDGGSNLKDEVRFHTSETVNSVTVNLADGTLFSKDSGGVIINIGSIAGVEYVRGTQQGDHITGDANDNLIVGYGGDDTLNAGDGRDYVDGGDGDDIISGGAGDDKSLWVNGVKTVNAGLYGGEGNDTLNGGSGEDWLFGGNGNDILESSGDRDHLYGDAGADTFVFKDISYNNTTLINDFDLNEGDKLDVSDFLSGFDPSNGDDINDYITLAEAAGHTYVWADQNGIAAGGNTILARLTGVTGLDLDAMYQDGDIII